MIKPFIRKGDDLVDGCVDDLLASCKLCQSICTYTMVLQTRELTKEG